MYYRYLNLFKRGKIIHKKDNMQEVLVSQDRRMVSLLVFLDRNNNYKHFENDNLYYGFPEDYKEAISCILVKSCQNKPLLLG